MRLFLVDENMFYKGVDKRSVHDARLHQSHSVSEPFPALSSNSPLGPQIPESEIHPPYPFESGSSLLALTAKHNVIALVLPGSKTGSIHIRILDDNCPDRI
jgi:hypothetical protein